MRYRTNADRVRHRDELVADLASVFRMRRKEEWLALLRAHDVPASPVNLFEEVFEDPQVKHNQMLVELEHPLFGRYRAVNNPIRMSRTPPAPAGYAPRLGENTAEILGAMHGRDK